jgi:hypothetical protein
MCYPISSEKEIRGEVSELIMRDLQLTKDNQGVIRKQKKEERRSLIYTLAEHIFMWFIYLTYPLKQIRKRIQQFLSFQLQYMNANKHLRNRPNA